MGPPWPPQLLAGSSVSLLDRGLGETRGVKGGSFCSFPLKERTDVGPQGRLGEAEPPVPSTHLGLDPMAPDLWGDPLHLRASLPYSACPTPSRYPSSLSPAATPSCPHSSTEPRRDLKRPGHKSFGFFAVLTFPLSPPLTPKPTAPADFPAPLPAPSTRAPPRPTPNPALLSSGRHWLGSLLCRRRPHPFQRAGSRPEPS